ncbi:ADP-ribose pyrophosphatase YjhB, NUDIX family [Sinosporangium album]|uniref:ADP-ribose pyrophosphatase YjhB, NUDIX family n=1 Tax=Sinosporangium album TaxID=504805 RepID=A0A1G8KP50_9ACTN|nr:NUDIX domain-containing protein [Sinosporangium album]SDI45188.1 ADP-ribose pyrophosphatase YjhB, NUDIX family [Sinosporangium album]
MLDYVRQPQTEAVDLTDSLPSASVVVTDQERRILLIRGESDTGWRFPGAFPASGETFEEAVRRELAHDSGVEIGELELLGVCSGPDYFHVSPGGCRVFAVTAVYTARIICRGQADLPFFPLADLPLDIQPAERPVLAAYVTALSRLDISSAA